MKKTYEKMYKEREHPYKFDNLKVSCVYTGSKDNENVGVLIKTGPMFTYAEYLVSFKT